MRNRVHWERMLLLLLLAIGLALLNNLIFTQLGVKIEYPSILTVVLCPFLDTIRYALVFTAAFWALGSFDE